MSGLRYFPVKRSPEEVARNAEIVRQCDAGKTQKDVGAAFGISAARVNQILQKARRAAAARAASTLEVTT